MAELNKLERGLVALANADRDSDYAAGREAIHAVAQAWATRPVDAQLSWLRYHGPNSDMGRSLRSVLGVAAQAGMDLGDIAHAHDWMRRRNEQIAAGTWRT